MVEQIGWEYLFCTPDHTVFAVQTCVLEYFFDQFLNVGVEVAFPAFGNSKIFINYFGDFG